MADLSKLGTITIDRLARGFKVSAVLHRPGSDRPEPLGQPDHFPTHHQAHTFAELLAERTGWRLVDHSNGDPRNA